MLGAVQDAWEARIRGSSKSIEQAMIVHVLRALQPQVSEIMINANRNHDEYQKYGYPLVPDELDGFQGPLAGMSAAMNRVSTDYLFTCPCDGPLLPEDVVARLYAGLDEQDAQIGVVHDGDRLQPVCALLDCRLKHSLSGVSEWRGPQDRTLVPRAQDHPGRLQRQETLFPKRQHATGTGYCCRDT